MLAVRRVYIYVVAFVSLVLLAWGLSGILQALIEDVLANGSLVLSNTRDRIALNAAFATLGLAGWLMHWGMAQRLARDPVERAAILRRLFLYAALAVMVLAAANALQALVEAALTQLLALSGGMFASPPRPVRFLAPLPRLAVAGGFWWYYLGIVTADRAAVDEQGGAATLRRWYAYVIAFIALMALVTHLRSVVRLAWEDVATAASGGVVAGAGGLAASAATSIVVLSLWLAHWRARPGSGGAPRSSRLPAAWQAPDVSATLRAVYLFLVLSVAVAATLYGGWEVLFYAAGRALGVERPGGVASALPVALAGPGSLLLVYGAAWVYQRAAIQWQAQAHTERPRQAGVRRIYVYLVSLVTLATVASGAGGLLWTLADVLTNARRAVDPQTWWREQCALYASMLIVALPMWLLHWGRVAAPADGGARRSLARRIYVYLALLGAVLALLGAGVTAVYQAYLLVLGVAATANVVTNLARAVAVAVVSAVIATYHLRALRADLRLAAMDPTPPSEAAAPAGTVVTAASVVTAPELPTGGPTVDRPFGVLQWQGGAEHSEWFASKEQARDRAAALQADLAHPSDRVAIVMADEAYFTA